MLVLELEVKERRRCRRGGVEVLEEVEEREMLRKREVNACSFLVEGEVMEGGFEERSGGVVGVDGVGPGVGR
jgi:hypothetical protein